jgi:hypothetical protein
MLQRFNGANSSCKVTFLIEIGTFVAGKANINDKVVRFAWWTLATIVFGLVLAIRIRLLRIPLERDEGEYAYAGQLILQGIPPYKLAYNMKFPGTYAAYALIMSIFGQTIDGVHLGLILLNAATVALVFVLGRRLLNSTAGIAAAMAYTVLSVSPSVLGLAAHATNFVMLPVLGGILLILGGPESKQQSFIRLFIAGALFGTGVLMKQPGVLFILFGALYILWRDLHRGSLFNRGLIRILVFLIGGIVPFGITCLILWHAGVLDRFWFWTIDYAWQYGRLVPLSQAPRIFLQSASDVVETGWPLWILGAIGAIAGICNKRTRVSALFLVAFFFFSVLALCPGFYFRPHYFILVLPAVSLLTGVAIGEVSRIVADRVILIRFAPALLLALALTVPILLDKKIFFQVPPNQACALIYPQNPFLEALRIGDYIHEHTEADDTIAVLGSEPEIYFYSHRRSATGYIYTYELMEPQQYARRMQREMIGEIENARPKYLVSVAMAFSWLRRPDSDEAIFNWANEYMAQNYTVAGLVNIGPTETDYFFGDVPPPTGNPTDYILIYRRNL